MSMQTTITGKFVIGDANGLNPPLSLAVSLTPTGSNTACGSPNIASGSWQPLYTASLSDTRYVAFKNMGTTPVVLASTAAGGGINPILQPGDICVIPYTASVLPLYAQCTSNTTASVLAYAATEN